MTTNLKNEWIALEEECLQLLNEKINQHNLKNTFALSHPSIHSQITFRSDSVLIKKHNSSNFKSGISVKVFDKTIEETKVLNQITDDSNKENINSYLLITEYKKEDITKYNTQKAAQVNFESLLKLDTFIT